MACESSGVLHCADDDNDLTSANSGNQSKTTRNSEFESGVFVLALAFGDAEVDTLRLNHYTDKVKVTAVNTTTNFNKGVK
jgi:hypothetical protein